MYTFGNKTALLKGKNLILCTVFRYQHNTLTHKILTKYRYRKNLQKYRDIIFFFNIAHPYSMVWID